MFRNLHRGIDRLTALVGRIAVWGIVLAIAVAVVNAISRKAFDLSSNALLELQWYLFGAAFMFAASWTLARNEHTRIDVLAGFFGPRLRNWIDLVGHLVFLAPFVGMMIWHGLPWALRSIQSGEVSANAGGLPIWPAKTILVAGFILLAIQTVSELIKVVLRLLVDDSEAAGR